MDRATYFSFHYEINPNILAWYPNGLVIQRFKFTSLAHTKPKNLFLIINFL
jgi:hypothetical protein